MAAAVTHFALALVLLLTIIDISAAATILAEKPDAEPLSPSGYRTYIVSLIGGDIGMDDAAIRAWHLSFLPTNMTSEGKQRLLQSYYTDLNRFFALLTEEEAKVVAGKPNVIGIIANGYKYLQEDDEGALE
ncbi:hypothetical protein PVAP13_6NG209500 [Panicum virgatum]|uniref:Inhibitor I9 domain-containing protein n=1 Tax=Panicum virgatum TaxID=38727 RepID=A0A8T0R0E4_PANVG|nr:hypothetical protein PVAP13_6NG209500 [Panicum virgatum]